MLSGMLLILIAAPVIWTQEPTSKLQAVDDESSVAFVTSALEYMIRGGLSIEAKKFWSLDGLGDAVSITALKIYDKNDLAKPENASAYLTVVRNAFSNSSQVLNKSDRNPKITYFVLD